MPTCRIEKGAYEKLSSKTLSSDVGLDIFSMIRKNQINIREFKKLYDAQLKNGILETKNQDFVLQVLFHFSVIGNQPKQKNATVFRYENKEARLNFKEPIIIHRGLLKSLQIV